jgi:tetratricopeptide (TPR) repeat protein
MSQITVALDNFNNSVKLYGNDYLDDNHKKLPRAFCSHYMGLIDKNWCPAGQDKGNNLEMAKRHLQQAWELLKASEREFLTPVTLSEVCSYSSRDRESAIEQLGSWKAGKFEDNTVEFESGTIKRMIDFSRKPGGLDPNQSDLLTRALLIRGNIEYVERRHDKALLYYDLASQHDGENPYALLSIAQATDDPQTKASLFAKGWEALQGSDNLKKREMFGRVLALAWAVIANHELQQRLPLSKYLKELKVFKTSVRSVGKRDPLFFCPLTKNQVFFSELVENLSDWIKETPRKVA